MADDIENTPGYDKTAERKADELVEMDAFRNAIAGRFVQFFGVATPPAVEMYTHRGQLADEVRKNKQLAELAACEGRVHVSTIPVIDPKHKGKPNALSEFMLNALENPGATPVAAPVVVTARPSRFARAKSNAPADRSRSAPNVRPAHPPAKAAPPPRNPIAVTSKAAPLMAAPPVVSDAPPKTKPLMAPPKANGSTVLPPLGWRTSAVGP
eukprot:14368657-Heterocapsa_arctica.AAC.1